MMEDDEESAMSVADASSSDEESDYAVVEEHCWRTLQTKCRALCENTIRSLEHVDVYDDSCAFQLAACLMRNQSLETAEFILWARVTELGAQALAKGIKHVAALKKITIATVEEASDLGTNDRMVGEHRWNVLRHVCQPALEMARELTLDFPFDDNVAVRLLLLLSNNNRELERLSLNLGCTSEHGMRELWKGLPTSHVIHLDLDEASTQACRVLFSEGVLSMPSLWHLNMSGFDDVDKFDDWSDFANRGVLPPQGSQTLPRLQTLKVILEESDGLKDRDIQQMLLPQLKGHCNLRQLTMEGNDITDEGVACLSESWSKWPQLKFLNLCYNNVGTAGLSRLARVSSVYPSFQTLDLSHNSEIGCGSLACLGQDLIKDLQALRLQHLNLGWCELTDMDMEILCQGLCHNSTVKSLELTNNDIGDRGVASLVQCLNNGLPLEELYLSSNPIGAVGVQSLVTASSARHAHLKKLQVHDCNTISYQDLTIIAKELSSSKLSSLWIQVDSDEDADTSSRTSDNNVAHSNCPIDKKAQQDPCRMASRALVDAVRANMHLHHMSLELINIPERDQQEIQFFLNLETSGRQLLRLDGGLHPFGLWGHVLAKCRNNASVLFYLLLEQPALIPSATNNNNSASRELCEPSANGMEARKRKMGDP